MLGRVVQDALMEKLALNKSLQEVREGATMGCGVRAALSKGTARRPVWLLWSEPQREG